MRVSRALVSLSRSLSREPVSANSALFGVESSRASVRASARGSELVTASRAILRTEKDKRSDRVGAGERESRVAGRRRWRRVVGAGSQAAGCRGARGGLRNA